MKMMPPANHDVSSLFQHDRYWQLDFAGLARATFHTERLMDIIMFGFAYQNGMVPLSLEACESALRIVEVRGYGRALEAFEYGRHLAVSDRPVVRQQPAREPLEQLIRRKQLALKLCSRHRRSRATTFQVIVQRAMEAMPGLGETDPGRQAQSDFVVAVHRCLMWGGAVLAERYAGLVIDLYLADRGDRGRSITRDAILPLAQAMLIRDPVHVATMAVSVEHRRRTRRSLNVKRSRDDVVERRFLTRYELEAFNRRFRIDLRTSDWPAEILASLRGCIPQSWRGSRRTRAIRKIVVDFR